jgi:hypothetical protein
MPRATVDLSATRHVDLKTLPGEGEEQGFVILRRLTYGQKVQRGQLAMEMSMQGDGKRNQTPEMAMKMTQERVVVFDFGNCIVDHNLEDHSGRKLNFKSPQDVFMLDPRVGDEISQHIDDMNNFEDDLGNSETGFELPSSPDGTPTPTSSS